MKTMKILSLIGFIGLTLAPQEARAQTTITSTTLSAAITTPALNTPAGTSVQLTSNTGVAANQYIYVGQELMYVTTTPSTSGPVSVRRGAGAGVGGIPTPHYSGEFVYVGPALAFQTRDVSDVCTSSSVAYLPWINVTNGNRFLCTDGMWGKLGLFYVPPTQCTFAPTTLTTTNTYPQIGASNIFVLNAVSNAAAGTNTLVCNILVPTEVSTGRGSVITDIVVPIGSQVTAPTSIGTATFGSITLPTPSATTQTASTVTPVTAGGTITQVGPTTTVATVTTAGSFLTFSYNFSTVIAENTDYRIYQFTLPILQSAAAAMTLNTPGLLIHYQKR